MANAVSDFIENLKELANPETFISEIPVADNNQEQISNYRNDFFYELWDERSEQYLVDLLWLCGPCWLNYIFDAFFTELKKHEITYYINRYIRSSSKTIADYFSKHPEEIFKPAFNNYPKTWKSVRRTLPPSPQEVSTIFYYDFSEFLFSRVYHLIANKRIAIVDRKRISKLTGKEFRDSMALKSISFHNRRIPEWDLQDYRIEIASDEFDPFRRIGDQCDVENSLHHLRSLLDYLGFVPNKNTSIYEIYRNLPREKFLGFARLAENVFYPIRYAQVYGDWFKAVVASGYLGEKGLLKTRYGYRVIAKDGCVCNSLAEKIVDDWLHDNHIEHEKEPSYPRIVRELAGANFRADWRVGDIYIEYFGLQTEKSYALKTSAKILFCQVSKITLIPLFPGDEYKLDRTLLPHLEKNGLGLLSEPEDQE